MRLLHACLYYLRFFLFFAVILGGSPVSAVESVVYYVNDIGGSPMAAMDQSGNLLWKESYRPYGDRLNRRDDGQNKLWFHGKAFDEDTGLSYFGARWYDPTIGRFMATDPQQFTDKNIHSFNRYAYGNNNPYRFRDPDGNAPTLVDFGFVIYDLGNFLGAGAAYVHGALTGNSFLRAEGLQGVKETGTDLSISTGSIFIPVPAAAAIIKTTAKVARPGKLGGLAHQNVVQEVVKDVEASGLRAEKEVMISTKGGHKDKRFADVGGFDKTTGELVEVHQVGRQTKSGVPVSREVKASEDIKDATGKAVRFHPYN